MTPKEKAKEFIKKIYPRATSYASDRKNQVENAKEIALILVDEIDLYIQKSTPKDDVWANLHPLEYWQEVKSEIISFEND